MYYRNQPEESSYDKFRTYKIKKGDTLESVAHKLGVDVQELRRYHNMYCEIPDLIEGDFKSHLEFLILAPENSDINTNDGIKKKNKKVNLASNFRLPFLPEQTNGSYKVKYTYEVEDEMDVIEMNVSVKWLATDRNKYHLFQINRSPNIYVNGKLTDTLISGLAGQTAEVLYPLKVVVDEFGKWIALYNYDEIDARWGETKNKKLDYYYGEFTEAYIEETEYALKSSDTLFDSLRSDYFLRAFFNGIYVSHTADYSFTGEVSFPIEKEDEAIFNVQQKIAPFVDDSDSIKVEQKGNYANLGLGILYGYDASNVNYDAVYILNSDTYTIEKLNIESCVKHNKPIRNTIAIELLENKKAIVKLK
ncbi:LysM peptidoglycan-binding domain-containing protein [Flavobacterium foetidum]|uniref:LysM peptidoglycan-binding domain-containing protein n=1 Tax=Flavobacterium foetidum TaxID=2026681 RepID=UPI001074E295|nr:LysM domain-containing protein [Flavobacterium foetidum]KAF2517735.1 LysM peptidoglycan-binding domain-containing protein [Flavobacterium foetidum]